MNDFTRDYSVKLIDSVTRTAEVSINGASVDDLIAAGYSAANARESVEQNAFQNAIARGEIGADCWVAA